MAETLRVKQVADGATLNSGETFTSDPINPAALPSKLNWQFGFSCKITGSGELDISVLVYNPSAEAYEAPTTPVTIIEAGVAGNYYVEFDPPLCRSFKIQAVEQGVNSITGFTAHVVFA